MKKLLASILALVMLFAMTGNSFGAEIQSVNEVPDIKIVMDGSLTTYKNMPISINGSNLLPLREMLVNLGVSNDDEHIIFNKADKSVTTKMGDTTIVLYIGKNTAYVNEKPLTLNVAPVIYKNSTYIPLRFVAEALGKKVVWSGSSRTVLICDLAKFENIKQLLDKSNEATANAQRYKMDMDISATAATGTMKFKLDMKTNAAVDQANKKMYMEILLNMFGMEISTGTYFSDNTEYSYNIDNGKWEKKIYSEKEYEEMFKKQPGANSIKAQDTLCAGLVETESSNKDEIVLSGDVYLTELYEDALSQQGNTSGTDKNTAELNNCELKMVLDKNTYLLKSLIMNVSAEGKEGSQTTTTDMVFTMVFSEYNGEFEVTVPQEVLETAVEAGSSKDSVSSSKL